MNSRDYNNLEPFALYQLYKRGDDKAFAALYDKFSSGLFNYLVRLLGDWHRAEDVLVETFTKLAHSNLDDRGSLKAWLYRVATNGCYKIMRASKLSVPLGDDCGSGPSTNPVPGQDKDAEIQALLNELPENHRVVIVMKFFEDMSYQEISETLCIPSGTVKSRMHEGIKNLRKIFNSRGFSPAIKKVKRNPSSHTLPLEEEDKGEGERSENEL